MKPILSLEDSHEVFLTCWREAKGEDVAPVPALDEKGEDVMLEGVASKKVGTLFHLVVNSRRQTVRRCLGVMTSLGPVIILESVINPEASFSQLKYRYSLKAPEGLLGMVGNVEDLSGAEIYMMRPAKSLHAAEKYARRHGLVVASP